MSERKLSEDLRINARNIGLHWIERVEALERELADERAAVVCWDSTVRVPLEKDLGDMRMRAEAAEARVRELQQQRDEAVSFNATTEKLLHEAEAKLARVRAQVMSANDGSSSSVLYAVRLIRDIVGAGALAPPAQAEGAACDGCGCSAARCSALRAPAIKCCPDCKHEPPPEPAPKARHIPHAAECDASCANGLPCPAPKAEAAAPTSTHSATASDRVQSTTDDRAALAQAAAQTSGVRIEMVGSDTVRVHASDGPEDFECESAEQASWTLHVAETVAALLAQPAATPPKPPLPECPEEDPQDWRGREIEHLRAELAKERLSAGSESGELEALLEQVKQYAQAYCEQPRGLLVNRDAPVPLHYAMLAWYESTRGARSEAAGSAGR